ncbi:hypothetical protein [Corynebacterium otitidis]|uniref:hypothetical protein n=1 Tax=Corynebacterium otitidis TaxID=29321 RepID=UPI0006280938|nr:hypothetical protein [Corynebacterium otitidis]KKO83454.1 hypothetical protein AAV33_06410 [Corynebacterium otitidis]
MVSTIVSAVLGVILLVGGFVTLAGSGHDLLAMHAAMLLAGGGALIITAIALLFDRFSPTSRKLES